MLKLGESTLVLNAAYEAHERPSLPERAQIRRRVDTSLYYYGVIRGKGWDVAEPTITS